MRLLFTILFYCFSLLLFIPKGWAQEDFAVVLVKESEKEAVWEKDKFNFPENVRDSLELNTQLRILLDQLHGKAYLSASVESIEKRDSIFYVRIQTGEIYEWTYLNVDAIEARFLQGVGFREKLFEHKPVHYLELLKLKESLLVFVENEGFPFAEVKLENFAVEGNQIRADLVMKKGPLITISGVDIRGDAKISSYYLENYLGFQEGSLYNKNRLLRTRNRLRELPFLQESRDASITFKGNQATVNLFVDKKKASRWDFLLGVLPQTNSLDPSKSERPIITTSILADMHNQLGFGEKIFFQFQQTQPQRQQIEFDLLYPYLLNLPFGVDFDFSLFRRDSAFMDVNFDIGIQYLMEGGNYVKAFWKNKTSFLQVIDTALIINTQRLPDVLDVSTTSLGLEYSLQRLDYRYNPRKGWSTLLRAGVGLKKIKENPIILEIADARVNAESLYDSLKNESVQYQADIRIERYFPLFKNSTLKAGVRAGGIFSTQEVYRNEQYRLGGNSLLRGFDEESINATVFSVFTLEYRLLIGTNSNFYIFGDYGYLEDTTVDIRRFDRPYGFGAGLTFETKVGIFGFSLALGSAEGIPIDLRKVKTHFGYVSYF